MVTLYPSACFKLRGRKGADSDWERKWGLISEELLEGKL